MDLTKSGLQIKNLSSTQEPKNISCPKGIVSVIKAYSSSDQFIYTQALSGQGSQKLTISLDDTNWSVTESLRIGFGEELTEDINSIEYLKKIGVPESEIDGLLQEYGLDKYCYLSCLNLPAPAARQLLLLSATRSNTKVLVLNDPFEPLSGRWRERFAELLNEDAKKNNRVTIITSLSMTPQIWQKTGGINLIELGGGPKKKIVQTGKLDLDQIAKDAQAHQEAFFDKENPGAALALLSSFGVPSKHLEKLANLSHFLRKYSVALILLGLAGLFAIGAFIINYGMKANPIKVSKNGMGSMEGEQHGRKEAKASDTENTGVTQSKPNKEQLELLPNLSMVSENYEHSTDLLMMEALYPNLYELYLCSPTLKSFLSNFPNELKDPILESLENYYAAELVTPNQENESIIGNETEIIKSDNLNQPLPEQGIVTEEY